MADRLSGFAVGLAAEGSLKTPVSEKGTEKALLVLLDQPYQHARHQLARQLDVLTRQVVKTPFDVSLTSGSKVNPCSKLNYGVRVAGFWSLKP